jgi:hypothetical protein
MRSRNAADANGQVVIWALAPDGTLAGAPLVSAFLPSAATCVDATTEDVFVAGGFGGEISLWSVKQPNRAVAMWSAHRGPVLALRALAEGIVATIGGDGALRIWDTTTQRCLHEDVSLGEGAQGQGLLTVAFAPDLRVLAALTLAGRVVLYDFDRGGAKSIVQTPAGVSALAIVGDLLVTADAHAPTLRASSLPDGREVAAAACEKPVLALASATSSVAAVLFRDGSASLWNVEGHPHSVRTLEVRDARSVIGVPRRVQGERAEEAARAARDARLIRAREALAGGRTEELQELMDGLAQDGLDVETAVFLAESFRVQGRPLWELRTRLALVAGLPDEAYAAVHCYVTADLLEQLAEPARALALFERTARCDTAYRDVAERVRRLSSVVPSPSDPPAVVLDRFAGRPELLLQEVEKVAALGEVWVWRATVAREDMPLGHASADLAAVRARFSSPEAWVEQDVTFRSVTGELETGRWLVRAAEVGVAEGLAFAVEGRSIAGLPHLVLRSVAVPTVDAEPDAVAFSVARAVQALQRREVQTWLEVLKREVTAAVGKAVQGARKKLF